MFRILQWALKSLLLVSGILPFMRCAQGYQEKDGVKTYNGEAVTDKDLVLLNEAFAKDSGHAYYKQHAIAGADAASFVAVDLSYAKDAAKVYYCDEQRDGRNYYLSKYQVIKTVAGADAPSFTALEAGYCKDRLQAYYGGQAFRVKDLASLTGINAHFAKDNVQAYFNCKPIPGSDGKTFTLLDDAFAKDSGHIYYYADQGSVKESVFVLPCNSASFKVLAYPFSKDDVHVFYRQQPIAGADAATFTVLSNGYAKDKNAVYIHAKKIRGAAVDSFEVLTGEELTSEDYYSKDHDAVYWYDKKLATASPSSFTALGHGYATDGKRIYYKTGLLANANAATFRVYPHDMGNADATDATNQFHRGKMAGEEDTNFSY